MINFNQNLSYELKRYLKNIIQTIPLYNFFQKGNSDRIIWSKHKE
jgi:hypothetical protein